MGITIKTWREFRVMIKKVEEIVDNFNEDVIN